jgi:hypothetical protein
MALYALGVELASILYSQASFAGTIPAQHWESRGEILHPRSPHGRAVRVRPFSDL